MISRPFALALAVFLALSASLDVGEAPAQACSFEGQLQMNPETLVDGEPVRGTPDADLLVVEFFDPNCPHCQRFHPVTKQVLNQYGDQIRFYMQPVPLWQFSTEQMQAMFLAKEKGKYYEMIDAQLTSPNAGKGGMATDQIVAVADEIGIDPGWMRKQLAAGSKQSAVNRLPYEARKAGIESTPTLAIGKKIVGNRSAACIGQLIEQERSPSDASAESDRRHRHSAIRLCPRTGLA